MKREHKIIMELEKAKAFANTHRENFPGFKDIVNPAYKAAESQGLRIEMPSFQFDRQDLIDKNQGSLGIFGIADSEFFGADLATASRLNIALQGSEYLRNAVSQYYAPKGKEVFSRKTGFSYENHVGVESRSTVSDDTIIQHVETYGEEHHYTKMILTLRPRDAWNAIELNLDSMPENGPEMEANFTFEAKDVEPAEVLDKVYAHTLDNIGKLRTPDFTPLMLELVGLSSWLRLYHSEETHEGPGSIYYTFNIDPNGIKGSIRKKDGYARRKLEDPRFSFAEKDYDTATKINIYRWDDIEKATEGMEPGRKKSEALRIYLENFPPKVRD